jgi:hypothetical protein
MKSADVSSLRMLRQARDRIDRDYAEHSGGPGGVAQQGSPTKSAPIPDGWRDDSTIRSPPHAPARRQESLVAGVVPRTVRPITMC